MLLLVWRDLCTDAWPLRHMVLPAASIHLPALSFTRRAHCMKGPHFPLSRPAGTPTMLLVQWQGQEPWLVFTTLWHAQMCLLWMSMCNQTTSTVVSKWPIIEFSLGSKRTIHHSILSYFLLYGSYILQYGSRVDTLKHYLQQSGIPKVYLYSMSPTASMFNLDFFFLLRFQTNMKLVFVTREHIQWMTMSTRIRL